MKNKLFLIFAIFIIGISWYVTLHFPKSYRTYIITNEGTEYYWNDIFPKTKHGICAHLYYGEINNKWIVEKPEGVDNTHMSLLTFVHEYSSKEEAETWIEAKCPSISRRWVQVK